MKKYCTKCGKPFEAVGREVICPDCKAQAAEESKKAAVERAKMASWRGESVPVRISGRASTVIREFGSVNSMTFTESLDYLLKASNYFKSTGRKWEEVEPYKSRRRNKSTATSTTDDVQEVTSKPQDAPQAAKTSTSKQATKKAASKTSTAGKATSKATSKK